MIPRPNMATTKDPAPDVTFIVAERAAMYGDHIVTAYAVQGPRAQAEQTITKRS